ncbi:MAG: 30S ribosomal protein S6e [Candidatus Micrarchaeota archaeon]
MRIVVSDKKTGKSYNIEVAKETETSIIGKVIGEQIEGGIVGAAGYSFQVTGGSDKSGFPMRRDIGGTKKARILLTKGVGYQDAEKGQRKRKLVRGNVISLDTMQVNVVVSDYGTATLEQLFPPKAKEEAKK